MSETARAAVAYLAALNVLGKAAPAAKEAVKAELVQGDGLAGFIDGHKVGTATWVTSNRVATVADEAGFVQWVKDHCGETEIVEVVREAFRKHLLVNALEQDGQVWLRGEVCPYVVFEQLKEPYVKITPTKDAAEIVSNALASGRLSLDGTVKALESNIIDAEVES
ncbi:hypothetical protein [Mycobacteroides abscessus]|uniref:Uncharacterized protein n=3 Tax=Bacillati TaxID=1783272 RepID=B1MNC7_MYCA9|nr:hypothetical protein [Mycobacteroides abscessus]EUA60249.1 hypothetical protein I542_0380 [Mycobacteroides abscessus 1948]QSM01700.1 dsDNA binding protein [Mycobacterium phage prophiGD11-1]QSM02443.1 dsDNA binding protein [Mycobacterium phage prophiGD17-2]QSM03565.1 dsDNA binding protein [Mycobacterium phage prophiGD43A-1]QSM03683.1 dsDNA binding protein [Mycobacterium phage prophiGD15-1]QSM04231.1 dsDNA binding protein [Mycobacterium phage prophiGD27-1]QSM04761.1 dsDNA binding protein [M